MVRSIPRLDLSLTVPFILLLAARGLAAEATDPPPASPPNRNEAEVQTECSRCKSSGRITCPTCKGAGNIHKVCPACNGKGRRPCPQCAAGSPPGANGSATPGPSNRGRIPCLACSGRGTLDGNSDRPCFRCRGIRDQACPTCIGRGDLSCPKTRYVGTCSTCGFVGKVPCPSCQEDSPVEDSPASASEFDGRRESNDKSAAKSRARSGSKAIEDEEPAATANGTATATSPAQQEPYTEARFQADQKSVAAKWEVLGKDMEVVRGLFAENTTDKLRKTKSDLLRLARDADSLAESGHAPARELGRRAREGVKRIEPLDTAWSRLDSRYDRLQSQFKSARSLWESQPRWSLDLPQGDQEAAQDKLAFLGQAIDLTSKSASRLREEKPEKISQGVEEVEAGAVQLRRELERTREVSRRAKTAAAGSNSNLGAAGRTPPEGREEPRHVRTPEESDSNGRQLDRPKKNNESKVSHARDVEDESSLDDGSAPRPAGGSWTLVAVLGALLAATLCAVAYLLADRRSASKDGK